MIAMKPVQSSLKKWMQENKDFKTKHLQMKQEILEDPEIKQILSKHPELHEKEIEVNLNKLHEYKTQSKEYSQYNSLESCNNIKNGYSHNIQVENKEIHL